MTLRALTAANQASQPQTPADGTTYQVATMGAGGVVSRLDSPIAHNVRR
jgi:hypothetical protein